jgi:putative transposase
LPAGWQRLVLDPTVCDVQTALHVLARRHPRAGYRKCTARLRRAGYRVNRKKVARLMRCWGFTRARPRPHPKPQGRPFDITRPNQLWQTDLTAVWCGEDGWGYFTAVIDCYCRSILGWSFTRRCRTVDVIPAMERAWSAAFPGGGFDDDLCHGPGVVLRHDNGTQFTSTGYRDAAAALQITLSRTAYRHPDGNAFIERVYLTLKEECCWITEFASYHEALAADRGLGARLQPRPAAPIPRRRHPSRSPGSGPDPSQRSGLNVNQDRGHHDTSAAFGSFLPFLVGI